MAFYHAAGNKGTGKWKIHKFFIFPFAQFPFASLIRRKKRLFCFTKTKNFPKIFYAAKNRTYTNTPAAICASKIAGMPNLKYQCRVLW